MHTLAENGIAAHWAYKSNSKPSNSQHHNRARAWLKNLLELQQNTRDSMEFLENVKMDLFPDEVYIFTPLGDIIELPRGATVIDFAYRVHTDVGNTCIKAKVDRHLVPLNYTLMNGQTVEIITVSGARPNLAWLNFVTTSKARSNIRDRMKNMQSVESIALGRRLINQYLYNEGLNLENIPQQRINDLLEKYKLETLDQLLEEVGLGNRIPQLVSNNLLPVLLEKNSGGLKNQPLIIKGTEGMVVSYAKCCYPIPGDSIIAFLSAGRGMVIHTHRCKNIADYKKRPEKWIPIQWDKTVNREFSAGIRIVALNQRGVLAKISATIADVQANIEHVNTAEYEGNYYTIHFVLSVINRLHLAKIMRAIRSLDMITTIYRVK
jgi:(p)ppGpp synthase/HD superfamily hydrolase